MCKIDYKIDYVGDWLQEGSGGVGGGCALASILLSTLSFSSLRFSFPTYSAPWGRKNEEHYKIQIDGAKCTFIYIYIYKELNVKTRIFPRSSFRSVPFVKKGIVKKKRNRYSFVPFL